MNIVATMSYFEAKCIKFDFDWGFAPDSVGKLSAIPQTLWQDFRDLLLLGNEGKMKKGRKRRVK